MAKPKKSANFYVYIEKGTNVKKEKVTITVPQPCNEDWNAMTPTDKGRHCAACQTTVIDFSILTDAQIVDTLKKIAGGHFCGHYHPSQLGREITKYDHSRSFVPTVAKGIAASLLFVQTIITSAFAQTAKPKTEQHAQPKTQQSKAHPKPRAITGYLKDNLTGAAIPGITINILSTDISTVTDKNGAFKLHVPDSFTLDTITMASQSPSAPGTYIPDVELSLNSALAANNVVIYRYPIQQIDEQTVLSYRKPIIDGGTLGGPRVMVRGGGMARPEIMDATDINKRKPFFRRVSDLLKFRKKHRS